MMATPSSRDVLKDVDVIPVLTATKVDDAERLADALAEGGIEVVEITLRTPAALKAIARLATRAGPPHSVFAGTILHSTQAEAAADAGASLLVGPCFEESVHDRCESLGVAYLPGIATVGEAARAAQAGHEAVKVFPAETLGGPRFLAHLSAVLPKLWLCPTGGVNEETLKSYLQAPGVRCVGGGWLTPGGGSARRQLDEVSRRAKTALAICSAVRLGQTAAASQAPIRDA